MGKDLLDIVPRRCRGSLLGINTGRENSSYQSTERNPAHVVKRLAEVVGFQSLYGRGFSHWTFYYSFFFKYEFH